MVRIAILDDHPAVLAGLRRLLDAEPDLHVTAVAASPPALGRELGGSRPDVLILDAPLVTDSFASVTSRQLVLGVPPGDEESLGLVLAASGDNRVRVVGRS